MTQHDCLQPAIVLLAIQSSNRTIVETATTLTISMTRFNELDNLKNKILFPTSVKEEQKTERQLIE